MRIVLLAFHHPCKNDENRIKTNENEDVIATLNE
jgi:hypothetical protein